MRPLAKISLVARAGAVLLALAAAAIFWVPALAGTRGDFPAPLDDVYIHFDFARSLGQGYPFTWIPGNGYSSGETSPLYAAILSAGWLVGLRGRLLGAWAAIVAILSVASLTTSIRTLLRPCPAWLGWAAAALPLSLGVLGWSLFSGMETAVFAAAVGRALEALLAARGAVDERRGLTREAAQWRLGAWGATLVLLRPESVVIAAVLALAAGRAAGRRSALAAVFRATLPAALATATVLGTNYAATGTFASAGAQLKLLSSNPYLSESDRARAYAENLATFVVKCARSEVPTALFALSVASLVGRRRRALGAACLTAAVGWSLLVSWNGASPFHNFRYYAPALLLVAIAAGAGSATIAELLGRRAGGVVAGLGLALAIASAGARLPDQSGHFARSARNIREQHVVVAEKLAARGDVGRVLVHDAGVIPYVSGLPALDALGLGGFRGMPFARAAVHGEGAILELVERLAPDERPTHLAIHPNWLGAIAAHFGEELDRVTIADNLITAGPSKVIYRADWRALAIPGAPGAGAGSRVRVVDEIDVGDLVSEREHRYRPASPHVSFEILRDADGTSRFDAGRDVPDGAAEHFVVRRGARRARLVVRTSPGVARVHAVRPTRAPHAVIASSGASIGASVGASNASDAEGAWRHLEITLIDLEDGEEIALVAGDAGFRDFHVWILDEGG